MFVQVQFAGPMSVRWTVVSVAFVAASATVFIVNNESVSGSPGLLLFAVFLVLHAAYGVTANDFRALAVAAVAVPLAVAVTPWDGYDTPAWVLCAFAEAFYGVPLVLIGVLARRLWQARRPAELPAPGRGEETGR